MALFTWPPVSVSSSSPSTGATGSTAPVQATEVGFLDASGNLQPLKGASLASGPNVAVTSTVLPTGAAQDGTDGTGITPPSGAVGIRGWLSAIYKVLLGALPTALGAKTTANSMAVNVASDQVLNTTDASNGSVTGGTAGTKSVLDGGIFNTSLPTLTNGQQAAQQLDSSGRLITAPLTNASLVKAQLQDNAGTAITVGSKVSASSVPVVIASDQVLSTTDASNGSVGAGTAGTKSALIGGVFNTVLPTLTTGQQAAAQLDSSGRQLIGAIPAGANSIGNIGTVTTVTGVTTVSTVTAVTAITNALPAGTNTIGTVKPQGGTFTDKSGTTSATPSTSTTVAASNAARKYFIIQNVHASNIIWINFTTAATAAQPSIQLTPGASFVMESSYINTEAITVLCTVASSPFSAKEG